MSGHSDAGTPIVLVAGLGCSHVDRDDCEIFGSCRSCGDSRVRRTSVHDRHGGKPNGRCHGAVPGFRACRNDASWRTGRASRSRSVGSSGRDW